MADWSMLPCDMLAEIALKLECFDDLVYFSVVCSSWQRAYSMIKKKWSASCPLLLLAENTEENPKSLRKLFSPNKRICYELELPETFGARCWGTSSGWVVTIDLTLELYVFNPLTGVRMRLPPQSTMPFKRDDKKGDIYWLRLKYVDKAYVFDLYNDDFVAVALHGGILDCKIAYARPGDDSWTLVSTPPRSCAHDVLRLGTNLFVVFVDGRVGYCDIPTFQKSEPPTAIRNFLPMLPLGNLHKVPYKRFYLVEAFGNLLFVYRYKRTFRSKSDPRRLDKDACYLTKGFDVYMFNFETNSWNIVKDLGDVSLFVGNNCSLALTRCAKKNLKSNCIYYTDDQTSCWEVPKLYGGHDIGIYHLENKVIEPLYTGNDIRSPFCPAFWFVPKLSC